MNKKAQIGFQAIVIAAVSILIGLAFYTGSISENIGVMTKTNSAPANVTVALGAAGTTTQLSNCGQKALTYYVTNASGGEAITASNYTLTQGASNTDGYLIAKIKSNGGLWASTNVNVSCPSYEPRGYVNDGGSRAIVGVIAIFMAILILIAALPNVRDTVFDWFKR